MRTFHKSAGTLCTAPGEIAFLVMDFILAPAPEWPATDHRVRGEAPLPDALRELQYHSWLRSAPARFHSGRACRRLFADRRCRPSEPRTRQEAQILRTRLPRRSGRLWFA